MSDRALDEQAMHDEAERDNAEGHVPDDLRDPVEDELETDPSVPDPEDDLEERDDTHYTDRENET